MKRRDFLKTLAAVPAVVAMPSLAKSMVRSESVGYLSVDYGLPDGDTTCVVTTRSGMFQDGDIICLTER